MIERFTIFGAFALIGVGCGSLVAPRLVARAYGVDTSADANVYLRGLGVRDAAIGAMLLVFARRGERDAIATTLALTTCAGVGDTCFVIARRGAIPNLALHVGGLVALAWLYRATAATSGS